MTGLFKENRALLIMALLIAAITLWLQPRYVFTGDSLNKLVQAEALIQSGFKSEELHYPAHNVDPRYEFFPFTAAYHLQINGRHLGQYPLFYSVLSALLTMSAGALALPWMSVVSAVAMMLLLRFYWKARTFTLMFAMLGTGMLIYAVQYSEVILSVVLGFAGLSLILAGEKSVARALAGGVLAGLGVWLRLEGILFFGALGLAWLIVRGLRSAFTSNLLPASIAFAVTVLAFLAFNQWDYGHILGPRYLATKSDGYGLCCRLNATVTLLITAKYRPGFFAYTPLFLWALVYAARPRIFKALDERIRILFVTCVIFLPLASLSAPNDGVTDWGARYLMLASLPSTLVLEAVLTAVDVSGLKRWSLKKVGFVILSGFSIVVTIVGAAVIKAATVQLRLFQQEFSAAPADIRLFQNELLASHVGLQYFTNPMVLARDAAEV
ncbi:MAG: hypothetical protein HY042_09720, partial [Spirochaetia bacterium]|nr:hypothetical protein [Spirochaetia bacterium]